MLTTKTLKTVNLFVLCAALFLGAAFLGSPQTAVADDTALTSTRVAGDDIFVDHGGADTQAVYLSDIPYANAQVGWGSLTLDKNGSNNGGITLKLNGSTTTFKKGIFAHATSTVDYDVSQYNAEYPYFVTYYGLNTTNNNVGNGVKFYVYTSNDGKNWDLKTDEDPTPIKSDDGAHQFRINVQGVKYIRLHANDNGSNASDHAVWADAKLVHAGYKDNIVKTVEELDAEIMSKYTSGPVPKELYLLLLQRNLIASVGQYGLRTFVEASPANRAMLEWFLNDEDALRLWTMAGAPRGSYVNSLQVLSNLYAAHKDDLQDDTESHGVRNGDLNLRMMLALSLSHASAVNLWIYNNQASNAVTRYEIIKDMYANNKFGDPTMFANLTVQEMRGVMGNQIDDEELLWLRDYTAKVSADKRFNPYNYIKYTMNYAYGSPQYYSAANYAKWDAKYNLSQYNLTYKSGCPKLWIVFEQGAVCGGLSKTGANIYGVWGYPSWPVGQPGHCAYIYMYNAGGGKNAWQLTNSIVANGWANTTPANMPYGWGAGGANVTNGGGIQSASYLFLAQEAQNEYDKFEQANMLMTLAKVYRNDWDKLVQIYNDAYEQEHINLDVWNGLVNIALDSRTGSTQKDLYDLAEQCAADMKYHPLPMYDLTRRLGAKITDPVIKAKFMMLVQSTLQDASRANSSQSIQAKEINAVANALLGVVDNRLATFSFDGANANKLNLAKAFQGAGVTWEYSLDGGGTWIEVHEDTVELTSQQVASINANDDIKVHVIGAPREGNIFTIDITQPSFSSAGISSNDDENRIYGTTSLMEYYLSEDLGSKVVPADATWTSFATTPNLEGDKRLFIRNRATGTQLPSNYVYYTYSANVIVEQRNYIAPSHLTVDAALTSKASEGATKNLLDGNANTYWRSANNVMPAYITIKLDEPRYVNSLEFTPDAKCKFLTFIPNGYPKNVNLYVSMDGANWEKVSTQTWPENDKVKKVDFTATRAQYVRLECTVAYAEGSETKRMACAGIKLYEDLTVDPTPRAKVRYDITGKTNRDVVAELVDISKPITVTNTENGATTHTFTENGGFTFEFVDDEGNQGSAKAYVDWIDKTPPQMSVSYSTTEPTNGDVVATMTFTEPVVITSQGVSILNSDGQPYDGKLSSDPKTVTFTENDSIDIEFVDETGNIGHKTVTVDWIDREEPTGTVTYSTTDVTDQPVIAMVEPDKEGVTVTSEGGETHTFTANGDFTFEMVDAAGNRGTATANVYWIKQTPKVSVSFSPEGNEPTTGPVDATIELPEGYRIMNNGGKNTHTFTESGEFAFQYLDPDGMQGSYPVVVDWIDHEAPKATITYDKPTATNRDVTATLSLEDPSGPVRVTSEGGYTHTFTDNGEFTFEFADALGNEGTATAKVDWIDRKAPTATVSYSTESLTAEDVVATLVPSEPVTVRNAEGADTAEDGTITHTFTENGEYTFEFVDAAGNVGTAKAKVDWIDKHIVAAEVEYDTTHPTNGDVVATLVPGEEGVTVTNNEGRLTRTFTDNGEFTFEFQNAQGNRGTATAKVTWIDREAPKASIAYDKATATNQDVTATLTLEDPSTPLRIEGGDTHTFTENGEHTFEFADAAGNVGTATAKVTWIDRDAPTATVSYNTTSPTAEDVVATLVPSEDVTVTNGDGTLRHTFTENGEHTFEFQDAAGNKGFATAKVTWIDKQALRAQIEYSTKKPTNKDVVVTLVPSEEGVTVTNNEGRKTRTFTENGEFTFEFQNAQGKRGTATAKVAWIDREAPKATIKYSRSMTTDQDVTATLKLEDPSKPLKIEGGSTHVFTENGEHTFAFADAAGNEGTATAKVDWIEKGDQTAGGNGAADPTDTTNPTDPANPANPTNPTNPTDPTDPTNPFNPINLAGQTVPMNSTGTANLGSSIDSPDPADSDDSVVASIASTVNSSDPDTAQSKNVGEAFKLDRGNPSASKSVDEAEAKNVNNAGFIALLIGGTLLVVAAIVAGVVLRARKKS